MSEAEKAIFHQAGTAVVTRETVNGKADAALLSGVSALAVVSAKVGLEEIQRLTDCQVIARYGSGTDNIDIEAATSRGIVVTNVPDFCLSEMANHTMALLLRWRGNCASWM